MRFIISLTAVFLLLVSCKQSSNSEWSIQDNPLLSIWTEDVDPNEPWSEYPRPYLERDEWMNLNGLWQYAIAPIDSAVEEWHGNILVPYPLESALSGVKKSISEAEILWYKRNFTIPSSWEGKSVILNFEASDWKTTVWIDGNKVGQHMGGYDPFSFDISSFLSEDNNHEITVSVWDPTDKGKQPRGKQLTNPHGIWYTPVSGIWQTVWLEPVHSTHLVSIKTNSNIENGIISILPDIANINKDIIAEIEIRKNDKSIIINQYSDADKGISIEIDEFELWTPENPVLYEIEISLIENNTLIDKIISYTGFRKISLGKTDDGFTRILLNNEFVFQNGPLDQGFWPDGIYTPPTEEAMVYDLRMTKKMGFNMLRKHVKIENRRFYYWCDKLGILVWQDMPSGDEYIGRNQSDIDKTEEATSQFEFELKRLIETRYNHPSIIVWVPFNEGWGQFETGRITQFIKDLDPERLVNSASGWTDRGTGDILDIHNYPDPRCPEAEEHRAIVLGEFGGLGLPVTDHTWEQKNWGYQNMQDQESLLNKYEEFYNEVYKMVRENGLSATVYTQTTDVETETNGLMTYDRKVDKMGAENVYKANKGILPPSLLNDSRIFIDEYHAELEAAIDGSSIYYSIDGSEVDENSTLYEEKIKIKSGCELKVLSITPEGRSRSKSYFIDKVDIIPGSSENDLQKGLKLDIFEGKWTELPDFSLETPIKTLITDKVDLEQINSDSYFGLVFSGYIKTEMDAVYGFSLNSDDGSSLYINDNELIANDGIHGMRTISKYTALGKGYHKIRIEYFQGAGGMGLELLCDFPGEKKKIIAPDILFHK